MNTISCLAAYLLLYIADAFRYSSKLLVEQQKNLRQCYCKKIKELHAASSITVNKPTYNNQIQKIPYNWKKQWYAVTFACNIPKFNDVKPLSYSVFDVELVFWRDENGRVVCTEDKCPHRGTRLSEGQVLNGHIECLYHGWTYEGTNGTCVSIPQLPVGGSIPAKACLQTYATAVHEGILFVWMDKPETADYLNLPKTRVDLDNPETMKTLTRYDFIYDLPYDHSYLIENLLDPAHIPISHDKTEGGGIKENAQPFNMFIRSLGDGSEAMMMGSALSTAAASDEAAVPLTMTSRGFNATSVRTRPDVPKSTFFSPIRSFLLFMSKKKSAIKQPILLSQDIDFEAPGIIRYHSERGSFMFGAALHCMPMGLGRSRLLFTTFFRAPLFIRLLLGVKPMWLRHLNSCKVLEQDIGLVTSQEDVLYKLNNYPHYSQSLSRSADKNKEQLNPADEWLPLASSDTILLQYRKWLDSVGASMPYYQGWRTRQAPGADSTHSHGMIYPSDPTVSTHDPSHRMHNSRYYSHVIHHKSSLRALKRVVFVKHFFTGLLAASSLASISLGSLSRFYSFLSTAAMLKLTWFNNISMVVSLLVAFAASKLEKLFYTNFKRHNEFDAV